MTYGPTIETLDDWNYRLEDCGCCPMPYCPVPSLDCERYYFSVSSGASFTKDAVAYQTKESEIDWTPPDDEYSNEYLNTVGGFKSGASYLRRSYVNTGSIIKRVEWTPRFKKTQCGISNSQTSLLTYSGVHVSTYRFRTGYYDPTESRYWTVETYYRRYTIEPKPGDPTKIISTVHTIERDSSGAITEESTVTYDGYYAYGTENEVITYLDPHSIEEAISELNALIAETNLESCSPIDTYCDSERSYSLSSYGKPLAKAWSARFRFEIPSLFPGTYFAFTWDEVFFPDGYNFSDPNDPANPTPVVLATDRSQEWIGPGDLLDPESWFTDWNALSAPTDEGTVQIRNIRYECYRSPYGSKPQVTGQAWAPPA